MEVRLPLAWKSHPVLIDPHPPPSLYWRLRALLPSFSPKSSDAFSQPPSLLRPFALPCCPSQPSPSLSPCFLSSSHPSLRRCSLFKPSPPFSPIPLSASPFCPAATLAVALSASRRNSLSRKKREKGAKNRFSAPIGRVQPDPRQHWSAACFRAWLKDELSLCHRLY